MWGEDYYTNTVEDAAAFERERARDEYDPPTTLSEAHAHWHATHGRNAVCDLDCGAGEGYYDYPEIGGTILCGRCQMNHPTVADVRLCHGV